MKPKRPKPRNSAVSTPIRRPFSISPQQDSFPRPIEIGEDVAGGTVESGRFSRRLAVYLDKVGADIEDFTPNWFSPILSETNWYLPPDKRTLNHWIRYYDTFSPVVGPIIDLHTQLPLSRFCLKGIADPAISRFYEEVIEAMDGYTLMYRQLRDYWLLGEAIVWLVWDDSLGMFTGYRLLPPEYVDIKGSALIAASDVQGDPFEYRLRLDRATLEFLKSNDPVDVKIREKYFPREVLNYLAREDISGEGIPLPKGNLMVMLRNASSYDHRGVSLVLRVLKDLIYHDKLQEAQFAIADRHIQPIEHWKVGNDQYAPSPALIDKLQEMVQELEDSPKRNIVTHYAVTHETYGAVGKFPRLADEFDWVQKRILLGLMIPAGLLDGSSNFSVASINYRVLMQRYLSERNRLEQLWINRVFLPIAKRHGFKDKNGDYILPEFDWREKANLLDDQTYKEFILRLWQAKVPIPVQVLLKAAQLDPDEVANMLEQERSSPLGMPAQQWNQVKDQSLGKFPERPKQAPRTVGEEAGEPTLTVEEPEPERGEEE